MERFQSFTIKYEVSCGVLTGALFKLKKSASSLVCCLFNLKEVLEFVNQISMHNTCPDFSAWDRCRRRRCCCFAWKLVDADACFTTLEFTTYLSGVTQAPLPLGINRVILILAHKENHDPARHSDLSVALDLRSFTSANALQLSANNSLLDGWWGRPWTWLCLH